MKSIKSLKKQVLSVLVLISFSATVFAIDRRQDQSPKDPSYALIPYAMSMPGIGQFYGFAGSYDNLFGSQADTYLATMTGDLAGYTGGIFDIPLLTEHLTLHYFTTNFNKASVDSFQRGIDSDNEQMVRLYVDKVLYNGYMLNLVLWEKRIQLYGTYASGRTHPTKILDKDGNLVADISAEEYVFSNTDLGLLFDYTDDRKDPRNGVRIEGRVSNSPPDDGFEPEFYRMDWSATYFLPIGKQSTWAFNHFRSDAVVTKEGETDPTAIAERIGIDCTLIPDPREKAICDASLAEQVSQSHANNKYGTATSLGGLNMLRAYPQGRFYAAHSRFYGTEFRWNITEGSEPFDFFIMKGIRTILQLALFHEQGTVADIESDLGDTWKTSTGAGFRLLMSSGMVFRFDVATGDEGPQTTLFFNYPWNMLN